MGSADPSGKMDEKLKSENMQNRAVFYAYVILGEQSEQAGLENGAMLTTYLFRYTSECTISYSNFLRLRRQGGIDPLTKILRTFHAATGVFVGWRRCISCGGDGRIVCRTCQGYKHLKCFINLRIE